MSTSTFTVGRAAVGASAPAVAAASTIDFDELVREHRRMLVWASYHRTDDWHGAEDAVQDALLYTWENRAQFRPVADLPPVVWVATQAKFRAMSGAAAARRCIPAGEWAERFAEDQEDRATDSGLPCMADPETGAAVYQAMSILPLKQQRVVQMHCIQGIDRDAIEASLGITTAQFYTLLQSAYLKLGRKRTSGRRITQAETGAHGGRVDPELVKLVSRKRLLDQLPPQQRQVLRLRFVDGYSPAATAQQVGLTRDAVQGIVRTAVARLRQLAAGPLPLPVRPMPPDVVSLVKRRDINVLLGGLSSRAARVVRLRYLDRLPVAAVAAQLGLSPDAVKMISHRAMRSLERMAADEDRGAKR